MECGMKKIGCLLVVFMLLVFGMSAVVCAENRDKVVDRANLLTDAQEERLEAQFTEIAERYQCDVAVVTTNSLGQKSAMTYTDDYYDANGYGYGPDLDGIILMVSMGERDWWMATRGKAIRIFTDRRLENIRGEVWDFLHDGDYYEAFSVFGEEAEHYMRVYEEGPLSLAARLAISAAVGLVAALLVVFALFHQLRTVRPKHEARDYVRGGSFRVTRANDLFLYRTLMRRKIEAPSSGGGSSTHSTSGGGRAGGIGGKF